MLDIEAERLKILTDAHEHRQREVLHHQINIDNYTLAIEEIEAKHPDNPAMLAFADRLRDLLTSSRVEQTKEMILRDVIGKQLSAGGGS